MPTQEFRKVVFNWLWNHFVCLILNFFQVSFTKLKSEPIRIVSRGMCCRVHLKHSRVYTYCESAQIRWEIFQCSYEKKLNQQKVSWNQISGAATINSPLQFLLLADNTCCPCPLYTIPSFEYFWQKKIN